MSVSLRPNCQLMRVPPSLALRKRDCGMATPSDQDDANILIYEEARRRLIAQDNRLATARSSSLAALSVSAIAGGLLAQRIDFDHLSILQTAGLTTVAVGTVAAGCLVAWLHWPKHMATGPELNVWLRRMEAGTPPSINVYTANMVRKFEEDRATNSSTLLWMTRALAGAWTLVALQLAGWAAALV